MRRVVQNAVQLANAASHTTSSTCPATSVPRAFSGVLASTSASSPLQELPARLRTVLRSTQLEAAVAEVAQLQARKVAAAARQMDAAKARIAHIRKQLSWERAESALAAHLAPTFCNALSISNGGQKLMLVGVPLAASWYVTDPALCYDAGAAGSGAAEQQQRTRVGRAFDALAEEVAMMGRAMYLLLLFVPVALTAPLCVVMGWRRRDWLRLMRWTLERAGPAFIKWGQWAATRPDMFPTDLCDELAALQTKAPQHDYKHTVRTIEAAFSAPLEEIFEEFAKEPVASGSIAQIHKAKLGRRGVRGGGHEPGTVVAVKVRHPGVTVTMQRDFALMQRAAVLSRRIPMLADLNLEESVRQFGAPLQEQLDLRTEAMNLNRFNRNFRKWKRLSFPRPIFPLVSPDVLVESFEEGDLISRYVDSPDNKHNVALADIGLEAYLKMLMQDNLIHADLHPGNILVRVEEGGPWDFWDYLRRRVSRFSPEHMVLLDVGMVAELTRQDQIHLVDFFRAISSKDGRALGENILEFADNQTCPRPEQFVEDMTALFDSLTWQQISDDTSTIIQNMMEMVRTHQVSLRGVVSTVVVTTLVLEGWSSKLDPDIKMIDKLRDILPRTWPERLQAYIRAFGSDREIMPLNGF